jgi:hypothetical protein
MGGCLYIFKNNYIALIKNTQFTKNYAANGAAAIYLYQDNTI